MGNWLIEEPITDDVTDMTYFYQEFVNNGIVSPQVARDIFLFTRYDYAHPDCPFCGCMSNHWVMGNGNHKCRNCKRVFSETTGTALENKKITYHQLFRIIWLIAEKKVTTSTLIAEDAVVTQKTAWLIIDMIKNHFGDTLADANYFTVIEGLIKPNNQPEPFYVNFNFKTRRKNAKKNNNKATPLQQVIMVAFLMTIFLVLFSMI